MSIKAADTVTFILTEVSGIVLPNGSYVIQPTTEDAFAVFRLLEDKYDAFIEGFVRSDPQEAFFEWLKIEICCIDLIQCADD